MNEKDKEQAEKDKNIFYILKNITMPGYTWIGTTNDLQEELTEMYSAEIILPYTVVYAGKGTDVLKIHNIISDKFSRFSMEHKYHIHEIPAKYIVSCVANIPGIEEVTREYTPEKMYDDDVANAIKYYEELQNSSEHYEEMEEELAMRAFEYEGETIYDRYHRLLQETIENTKKEIKSITKE